MNEILKNQLELSMIVFLDGILIYSKTYKDHLDHIPAVLETIRREKMFVKLPK